MLGMIIYGILLRSRHNISVSVEKKCNSRQILRALNDLTNEWSFLLLVLSDVGVSEGYDNKHKKDFSGRKLLQKVINFNLFGYRRSWLHKRSSATPCNVMQN